MAKHYCKTQQFWMSLYDFSILTFELHGFPINIDPAASLFTHLMLAFAAALPSFENVQGRKALRQFLAVAAAAAAAAVGRGRGRSRHAENLVCSSRQCDQKGRVKNRRRVNNFWAYLLELCIFINKFLPQNRQMAPKSPFLVTLVVECLCRVGEFPAAKCARSWTTGGRSSTELKADGVF